MHMDNSESSIKLLKRIYYGCKGDDLYNLATHFLLIVDNVTQAKIIINKPPNIATLSVDAWVECFLSERACTVIMASYTVDQHENTDITYKNYVQWAKSLRWTGLIEDIRIQQLEHRIIFYTAQNVPHSLTYESNPGNCCQQWITKIENDALADQLKDKSYTKLRIAQSVLDVCIVALAGSIGISAIIMSPVGLPFIVAASMLLTGIIGAFGLNIGRLCVDKKSRMDLLHYLSMVFKGGGIVAAVFTLLNACGILALPPALQVSLLCVIVIAMVGATVIDYKTTASTKPT
jgi:hypothetical protein